MASPSSLYEHTFYWEGDAQSVTVTGTFDNWAGSLALTRPRSSKPFSAKLHLPFSTKIYYKYIVNGSQWITSHSQPQESDPNGNVNNVFESPALIYPKISVEGHELGFGEREERNFVVYRWVEDVGVGKGKGKQEGRLEALAGLHLPPSLPAQPSNFTYSSFRTILDLILSIPLGGYRFGRLCSPSSSPESSVGSVGTTSGGGRVGKESEPFWDIELVEEGDAGEELLEGGFYLVLQPTKSPQLATKASLSSLSLLPLRSSAQSSDASFSTALSTTFSVSVLGSTSSDYVYLLTSPSGLWNMVNPSPELDDEIKSAWESKEIGFDPHNSFLPHSFTPTCHHLPLLFSYSPPSTTLERTQSEEYLEGHWLECLEKFVRGSGFNKYRYGGVQVGDGARTPRWSREGVNSESERERSESRSGVSAGDVSGGESAWEGESETGREDWEEAMGQVSF